MAPRSRPDRPAVSVARSRDRRGSRPPGPGVVLLHHRGDRPRRLVRPARRALAPTAARVARRREGAATLAERASSLACAAGRTPSGLGRPLRPRARHRALRHDDRAPQLRADVRLRHLLARASASVGDVRGRLARTQPVACDRGRHRLGARAGWTRSASRSRVVGTLGAVSGRRRAFRLRGTRARASAAGVSAHARDRDRALLVLGACGDGGLRTRRVDTVRRGLRSRVRPPGSNRAVHGSRQDASSSVGRSPGSAGRSPFGARWCSLR